MGKFDARCVDKWRKVIGEGRPIEQWYDRFSAWVPPSKVQIASRPQVSQISTRKPVKRDTFLWEMLEIAIDENELGELGEWRPQKQQRGTCVGQGWKLGCDTAAAMAYIFFNKVFPGRMAVATIYAGSRVEIAGRPGWSDGSNGYWAAEWVTEYGCTTLRELGLSEDSRYEDERLAVRWTGSRSGVPAKFEEMAEERPVQMTPRVSNIEEALLAIDSGSAISICSNLIPSGQCDKDGVSRVRRRGGHCMLIWGVQYLRGEPVFLCQNSWGPWGSPSMDGQPVGSVWITAGDLQSILNQNDSHAIVGLGGLEPLDWSLL